MRGGLRGYRWGFRIKVLAFSGAVDEPSCILRPLPTSVRWGHQGPERGRDLPIVTQYVRVTAIGSQLPHLSKRETDTLILPRRVPGTETGGVAGAPGGAPVPSRLLRQCLGLCHQPAAAGLEHCSVLVSPCPALQGDPMPLHSLHKPLLHSERRGVPALGSK